MQNCHEVSTKGGNNTELWNIIYIIWFIFRRILIYWTTNFVKDFKFLSSSFYYSNEFNVVFMPTLNQLFVLFATPIACAYGCKHFFLCNNFTLQKVNLSFWLKVIKFLRKYLLVWNLFQIYYQQSIPTTRMKIEYVWNYRLLISIPLLVSHKKNLFGCRSLKLQNYEQMSIKSIW